MGLFSFLFRRRTRRPETTGSGGRVGDKGSPSTKHALERMLSAAVLFPMVCMAASAPPVTNDDPALASFRSYMVATERIGRAVQMADFCRLRGPKWVQVMKTIIAKDFYEQMPIYESASESRAHFELYAFALLDWRSQSLAGAANSLKASDCAAFAKGRDLAAADTALRHEWRRMGGKPTDFDNDR